MSKGPQMAEELSASLGNYEILCAEEGFVFKGFCVELDGQNGDDTAVEEVGSLILSAGDHQVLFIN